MADQDSTISQEIWKEVSDFPGYEVSDQGNVRSYWHSVIEHCPVTGRIIGANQVIKETVSRILRPSFTKCQHVTLCKNKRHFHHSVHRLVLTAFIGPCPIGLECCHNNGNEYDDRLINIRWDTKKANGQDRIKHGTCPMGIGHALSKLTNEQVIEIRKLRKQGHLLQNIANMFKISKPCVWSIVHHKTWKHI